MPPDNYLGYNYLYTPGKQIEGSGLVRSVMTTCETIKRTRGRTERIRKLKVSELKVSEIDNDNRTCNEMFNLIGREMI